MDNKVTYNWSYDTIKKLMKQRYFNKVDQIRTCHKDIANYYLESFVETKPLVDMNKNMQIRLLMLFILKNVFFKLIIFKIEMKREEDLFVSNHYFILT